MAAAAFPGLYLVGGKCGWPSSSSNLPLVPRQSLPPSSALRLAACRSGQLRCAAASEGSSQPSTSGSPTEPGAEEGEADLGSTQQQLRGRASVEKSNSSRTPESTDWIASSLTRRFGLGAGLAWVGFLAFGVVSEQIKTRTEVFLEEQGTRDVEDAKELVLPNNIRFVDLRVGGGASPQRGDLVLVDITGKVSSTGQQFVGTADGGARSLAFIFGSRPFASGMCEGVEIVLQSMKAGGRRRAIIPPELGFGEAGAQFGDSFKVPGGAQLEYEIQLQKVSIAPGYFPVFEELEPC